ncbi:MAG: SAM-dependent methyltransferase [Bacilli bacterium]|nr:SAM-dependent methyltransferase [Bacilli bacterium]
MNSKRLLAIASFIDKDDKLIDVGCDHGYLGIYLKQNNLVNDLLLTDLRSNALNSAIKNINKYDLNIKTIQTDGLNNIDLNKYNTVSISGMGTSTIIDILSLLKNDSSIKKLIIQSNNDLNILRKEIEKIGFYLDDEITVKENNIFYVICKFSKKYKKISDETYLFGINKRDKVEYYSYLIENYNNIIKNISKTNKKRINELKENIKILNELLKKCR